LSIRTSSYRPALVNGLLILIWVAACAGTTATLAQASDATSSPTTILLFIFCVAFISVFLLNTLYFLALGAACLTDDTPPLYPLELHNDPVPALPVAILYTVKDDFDPTALQACIDQDHAATAVFVLDDSTSREVSIEVDRFLEGHGNAKTIVVRRGTPRGFKAGNLNDAISGPAKEFDYFAPVDADCVLAPHFVSSLLSYLIARSDLAFVQARCAPRVPALTSFGERTAPE
jgi:hypothetical protein